MIEFVVVEELKTADIRSVEGWLADYLAVAAFPAALMNVYLVVSLAIVNILAEQCLVDCCSAVASLSNAVVFLAVENTVVVVVLPVVMDIVVVVLPALESIVAVVFVAAELSVEMVAAV
jgi:hypothetical protein